MKGVCAVKKLAALWLTLCMALLCPLALASDYPFEAGVDYYQRYRENGAIPSMLNFGCAKLAVGEDLYAAQKLTIKKGSTEELEGYLDEERMFYIYAKWQNCDAFENYRIDAMLVVTDPLGRYYATYGLWEQEKSRRGAMYSWFFDVTDCLRRCREENDGQLPKGEYAFTMFFNQKTFRVTKVPLI